MYVYKVDSVLLFCELFGKINKIMIDCNTLHASQGIFAVHVLSGIFFVQHTQNRPVKVAKELWMKEFYT